MEQQRNIVEAAQGTLMLLQAREAREKEHDLLLRASVAEGECRDLLLKAVVDSPEEPHHLLTPYSNPTAHQASSGAVSVQIEEIQ